MSKDSKTRSAYHHGDLPRVLVEKASELLDEKGVAGFSLREVARRADVAAAAPSHHFGNVTGLLTAVATKGFHQLIVSYEVISKKKVEPIDRVVLLCQSYIKHFKKYPGRATIMFQWDLLDNENEGLKAARPKTLHHLQDTVRSALPDNATDELVESVAKTLWATMHGLVTLNIAEGQSLRKMVRFAVHSVIAGSESGHSA